MKGEKWFKVSEEHLVPANDNEEEVVAKRLAVSSGGDGDQTESVAVSSLGQHLSPDSKAALQKSVEGEPEVEEVSFEYDLDSAEGQRELSEVVATRLEGLNLPEGGPSRLRVLGKDLMTVLKAEAARLEQGAPADEAYNDHLEEMAERFFAAANEEGSEDDIVDAEFEPITPEAEAAPEAKVYPIALYEEPEQAPAANPENLPAVVTGTAVAAAAENLPATMSETGKELATEGVKSPYEQLRAQWLEAKEYQEKMVEAYHLEVQEHYDGLREQSGWDKFKERFKATIGFKPQLPPELQAKRLEAFKITQRYNELSRLMIENREFGGKESAPVTPEGNELATAEQLKRQEVLTRYQRMYARASMVRMFEGELDMQEQAAEDLKIKAPAWIKKHPKTARFLGAASVGAVSAFVAGAGVAAGIGQALLRSATGGAAAGVAGGFIGKHFDKKIDAIKGEYGPRIDEIGKKITAGGVNNEELNKMYDELSDIYQRADKEERKKIMAILASSIAIGGLVGYGISELSDAFSGAPVAGAEDAASQEVPVAGTPAENVAAASAEAAAQGSEFPASFEGLNTAYPAEAGDNYWDIMEGQTSAGEMPVMAMVSEGQEQALIDLTRDALEANDQLRADLGFGDTMDDLALGAEVDLQKLNEIAYQVAEENGMLEAADASAVDVEVAAEVDTAEGAETAEAAVEEETQAEDTVAETSADATTTSPEAATGNPEAVITPEAVNDNDFVPSNVYEFVRDEFGGDYMRFEQSFQADFVNEIQDTDARHGGGIFGGGVPYMNMYHHFESFNMEQFGDILSLEPEQQAIYLEQHDLNPSDLEAWREVYNDWQEEGAFAPTDRFEEVAKSEYIEQLRETNREAA